MLIISPQLTRINRSKRGFMTTKKSSKTVHFRKMVIFEKNFQYFQNYEKMSKIERWMENDKRGLLDIGR